MAIFASGSDYANSLDAHRATYGKQNGAVTVTVQSGTPSGLNTRIENSMNTMYIDGGTTTWERPGKD